MPKAKAKKGETSRKSSSEHRRNGEVERVLVENFIALQKVMTNLSLKFDDLSTQIAKLLELFEISAKTLAKKDMDSEKSSKNSEEILKKIDNLLDQNKTIARGLTLMHELGSKNDYDEDEDAPPRPDMDGSGDRMNLGNQGRFQNQRSGPIEFNKYQKSISSRNDIQKP